MEYNFFEYMVSSERSVHEYIGDMDMYLVTENVVDSIKTFFTDLHKIFSGFLAKKKEIHELYKKKRHIEKKLKCMKRLCAKNKDIANSTIEIRSYDGLLQKADYDTDDAVTIINNILSVFDAKHNNEALYKFYQSYMKQTAYWDKYAKINAKDAVDLAEAMVLSLQSYIEGLEAGLYDFQSYIENYELPEKKKKLMIAQLFDSLMILCDTWYDRVAMYIEALMYEYNLKINHTIEKLEKEYVPDKLNEEDRWKKIKKEAKKIKTVTYGDESYDVYEMPDNTFGCFNYGGHDIYVEKGFFDLPKGYQLAILYHEIGHHQCHHFKPSDRDHYKITVQDEEALLKRIEKDMKVYYDTIEVMYYSGATGGYRYDRFDNGEELCYLLLELEADRFAVKKVGRMMQRLRLTTIMRQELAITAKKNLEANHKKGDPKPDPEFHTKYNMDRMLLRTTMI